MIDSYCQLKSATPKLRQHQQHAQLMFLALHKVRGKQLPGEVRHRQKVAVLRVYPERMRQGHCQSDQLKNCRDDNNGDTSQTCMHGPYKACRYHPELNSSQGNLQVTKTLTALTLNQQGISST